GGSRRGGLRGDSRTVPRRRALVRRLRPDLGRGSARTARWRRRAGSRRCVMDVSEREIELGRRPGIRLGGSFAVPDSARGAVLFGSSTGAAAALVTAAREPDRIGAVVSRGGRPDLAGDWLQRVRAPTLLIVGGADEVVIDLNREALAKLPGVKQLEIVPGATH